MLVHVILVDIFVGGQESFDCTDFNLIRKQAENIIADVVMHLVYDLPCQLLIYRVFEILCFFLHEWEKICRREVFLHLFELRYQPVSQSGGPLGQNLLLRILADYFNPCWLKNSINILISFGDFGFKNLLSALHIAINNRKGSIEVLLLVRNNVDDWVRILKWPYEHLSKKENSVSQDRRVAAHEHHFLLQHQQSQQI